MGSCRLILPTSLQAAISTWVAMELLWVLLLSSFHGSLAQTGNCSQSTLATLLPCLPYVEVGNTTKPGADCCTPLGSVFASDPTCLCQIAPLAKTTGIPLNQTRAIEVATLCNQTIPASVNTCLSGAIAPAATGPSSSESTTNPPPPPPPSSSSNKNYGSTLLPSTVALISSIVVVLVVQRG